MDGSPRPSRDPAVTEFDVHGLLTLRLRSAPAHIVAALTQEIGAPVERPPRRADIVIAFVDHLPPEGELRLLGLEQAGFDDSHFYLFDGRGHRARMDLSRLGEDGFEITCERAIAAVPLLTSILGLYLLQRRHVMLHASSFVFRGKGVLVAGWQKGGKTEMLLPFMAAGADYVADEWTVVGGDPPGLHGISVVARIWDWQLRQMPDFAARLADRQPARFRLWRWFRRGYGMVPGLARLRGRPFDVLRRLSREGGTAWQGIDRIPPRVVFGEHVWTGRAPLDRIFLPMLAAGPGTRVVPVEPERVARRMVHSLAFERAALTAAYQQFRFAFPDRANSLIETAGEVECRLLESAFRGIPAHEVRHPYPMPLATLYEAAAPFC